MTRAQRIAVRWYRLRSLRFKYIYFVPGVSALPDDLDIQPGEILHTTNPRALRIPQDISLLEVIERMAGGDHPFKPRVLDSTFGVRGMTP